MLYTPLEKAVERPNPGKHRPLIGTDDQAASLDGVILSDAPTSDKTKIGKVSARLADGAQRLPRRLRHLPDMLVPQCSRS
jgi:hypothetical protein